MSLWKSINTYFYLIRIQFKILLEYPTNLIFGVLATVMWHLPGFFLIWIITDKMPVFSGWSRNELLLLYGLSVFGDGVQHFLFEAFWSFGNQYIRSGSFDRLLIRPVNELFQIAGSRIDIDGLGGLLFGLFLTVFSLNLLDIDITVVTILQVILALLCSAIIYCSLNLLTACSAFWVIDNTPVTFGVFQMHSLNKFPTSLYPQWLRLIITWIIPTSFATFYPATMLLNKNVTTISYFALPFCISFLFISYLVWNLGVKRYQGTGS